MNTEKERNPWARTEPTSDGKKCLSDPPLHPVRNDTELVNASTEHV